MAAWGRGRRRRRAAGILGSTGVPHLDTRDLFLLNASRACFRRVPAWNFIFRRPALGEEKWKGSKRKLPATRHSSGIFPWTLLGKPSDWKAFPRGSGLDCSTPGRSIRESFLLSSDSSVGFSFVDFSLFAALHNENCFNCRVCFEENSFLIAFKSLRCNRVESRWYYKEVFWVILCFFHFLRWLYRERNILLFESSCSFIWWTFTFCWELSAVVWEMIKERL